ncbi:DUF4926 domain-containing protein [Pseudomonas fakonensis]|uniref:DUF4926 domain-containing protein n=2 Tax=Pseudomonas fakonensis TaxID=2842355 RepID=A0ABX8NAS0_9PSED|nr:DUF4926 domain-containing protein [Pseudomonas fakonensis]
MGYLQFDVVMLLDDFPEEGLRAGDSGTVIDIYSTPVEGYEVEFCDEQGRTLALLALSSDQIRPVK